MMPKHTLQPKLSQKPTVNQSLAQAFQLMNLHASELSALIETEAESNPFLEATPVESKWQQRGITAGLKQQHHTEGGDKQSLIDATHRPETLQDYLKWQASLTPFSPDEAALAELIIDAITPSGYLSAPLFALLPERIEAEHVELAYIVLHRIQQFDPPGVGAENLKECLMIQLNQLDRSCPVVTEAKQIIEQSLSSLNQLPDSDAIQLIKSLTPKPGMRFDDLQKSDWVIPEIWVDKTDDGRFEAYVDEGCLPLLSINHHYQRSLKQTDEFSPGLKSQYEKANQLIYQVNARQQSLLAVAQAIVATQQAFFQHGTTHLAPMTLEHIAQETGLHISTVSRLTQGKYMDTPRGIFALKYFLNHAIPQADSQISHRAVAQLIEQWIKSESPKHPLSDQDLTEKLAKRGIQLARRTVAKYREQLGFAAKHLRRS